MGAHAQNLIVELAVPQHEVGEAEGKCVVEAWLPSRSVLIQPEEPEVQQK